MQQLGTKRTREASEANTVLRYRHGNENEILPEDVKNPVTGPFLRHSFNVSGTFSTSLGSLSTETGLQFAIGAGFLLIYGPMISSLYCLVMCLLKSGSTLYATGGSFPGFPFPNAFLPVRMDPNAQGVLSFTADTFIPLKQNLVASSHAPVAEIGLQLGYDLPLMATAETKSARISMRSTAASITAAPLVGRLYAGTLPNVFDWMSQSSRRLPPYLYQTTPDKENTLQDVPLGSGITIAVDDVPLGQRSSISSTQFGYDYGGDGFRYEVPGINLGGSSPLAESKSIVDTEILEGQFNVWISPAGVNQYDTQPAFVGPQTQCNNYPCAPVPPGFFPNWRFVFGVQNSAPIGVPGITTVGTVFIKHFFMSLQQNTPTPVAPLIYVCEDAVSVTTYVSLPPYFVNSATATGPTGYTAIQTHQSRTCLTNPSTNGFDSVRAQEMIYIGTGLSLQYYKAESTVRFYLTGATMEIPGIGAEHRGTNLLAVYGNCPNSDQEIVVAGNIDVEGLPGPALAAYSGQTAYSTGETNFFVTSNVT